MNIVILTADGYSKFFDRRIVDQARILIGNGNKVKIITLGMKNSLHEIDGIDVIQFQRNQSKESMKQAEEDFLKFHTTGKLKVSLDVQGNTGNPASSLRKAWRRLPLRIRNKIGPLIFSMYAILLKVARIKDNVSALRNTDIRQDIWNDATTFVCTVEDQNVDLIVATDLASGIASLVLRFRNHSAKIWYDAHEYGSEQAWLKRRPGFTDDLKFTELAIVKGVELFSCVSEELTQLMAEEAKRADNYIVLPNVALKQLTNQYTAVHSQIDTVREIRKTHKVAIFHGVLSDIRGIDRFIEVFDKACGGEWRLVLMGYFLEEKTRKAITLSPNAVLIEAVDAANVLDIISEVDAVVMPYDILDLNTQFCFPNKLGDCLATRSKFIFNSNLKSISKIAEDFSIGLPFEMNFDSIDINSLQNALRGLSALDPKWDHVELKFGEENYRSTIINAVEKVLNEENI